VSARPVAPWGVLMRRNAAALSATIPMRSTTKRAAAPDAARLAEFTKLYRSVTNLYAPSGTDVFTYFQLSDEQGTHRAASLIPGESACCGGHGRALAWRLWLVK